MSADRIKSEHTGEFGYFPLSPTYVKRGLDHVIGNRTNEDPVTRSRYEKRLRQTQGQFCLSMDTLTQVRQAGGHIGNPRTYATGMMIFFDSAMRHIGVNRLTVPPPITMEDTRHVLLQDGAAVLGDQQLTNPTLLRMFDPNKPDVGSVGHEMQETVLSPEAEHNSATLTDLAATMQAAITRKAGTFRDEESNFVNVASSRYPEAMRPDLLVGAADCKHLLQSALRRKRLIES